MTDAQQMESTSDRPGNAPRFDRVFQLGGGPVRLDHGGGLFSALARRWPRIPQNRSQIATRVRLLACLENSSLPNTEERRISPPRREWKKERRWRSRTTAPAPGHTAFAAVADRDKAYRKPTPCQGWCAPCCPLIPRARKGGLAYGKTTQEVPASARYETTEEDPVRAATHHPQTESLSPRRLLAVCISLESRLTAPAACSLGAPPRVGVNQVTLSAHLGRWEASPRQWGFVTIRISPAPFVTEPDGLGAVKHVPTDGDRRDTRYRPGQATLLQEMS